jgi:hypothetical protein
LWLEICDAFEWPLCQSKMRMCHWGRVKGPVDHADRPQSTLRQPSQSQTLKIYNNLPQAITKLKSPSPFNFCLKTFLSEHPF